MIVFKFDKEAITELRESLELTMKEFQQEYGITPNKWESGYRVPSLSSLHEIISKTPLDVSDILVRKEKEDEVSEEREKLIEISTMECRVVKSKADLGKRCILNENIKKDEYCGPCKAQQYLEELDQ